MTGTVGVGVIGFGWMGGAHTRAYARLPHHYPDLPRPRLVAVADAVPGRAEAAARQYGFARGTTDWRDLLADPQVQAVSVTAPNVVHAEIGPAVAAAGRHLWIEKPVGLTSADAIAVAGAVTTAGVQATVGFNYRGVPALVRARELLAAGRIGTPEHARIRLLTDYAAHPRAALTWRFTREHGGSGVLGDLVSHGVDLARYLLGEIEAVVADTTVFIPHRPAPTTSAVGHHGSSDGALDQVGNEDWACCLGRFASGARLSLEASRVAVGEQNNYGIEVHGTRGLLSWDFRRMGELVVSTGDAYRDQPVTTVLVGPGTGEFGAFQPGSGIAMGYDDLKVIEAAAFLRSIGAGRPHGATVEDAVCSALALEAMEASARTGRWMPLPAGVPVPASAPPAVSTTSRS